MIGLSCIQAAVPLVSEFAFGAGGIVPVASGSRLLQFLKNNKILPQVVRDGGLVPPWFPEDTDIIAEIKLHLGFKLHLELELP